MKSALGPTVLSALLPSRTLWAINYMLLFNFVTTLHAVVKNNGEELPLSFRVMPSKPLITVT